MTQDWIKKVFVQKVKRVSKFPIPWTDKNKGHPTMSIDDLRALRRSRYYQHPDPDLTDRLVDLRTDRDLKTDNDIKRRKSHKNDRDQIISDTIRDT